MVRKGSWIAGLVRKGVGVKGRGPSEAEREVLAAGGGRGGVVEVLSMGRVWIVDWGLTGPVVKSVW
jgi:hypothetical protein